MSGLENKIMGRSYTVIWYENFVARAPAFNFWKLEPNLSGFTVLEEHKEMTHKVRPFQTLKIIAVSVKSKEVVKENYSFVAKMGGFR